MSERKDCSCAIKINFLEEQMKKLADQVSTLEVSLKEILQNEEVLKENMARLEGSVDTALKAMLPRMEELLQQMEARVPSVEKTLESCVVPEDDPPSSEEEAVPVEKLSAENGFMSVAPPAYEDVVPSAPLWDELLPPEPAKPASNVPSAGSGSSARAQSPLELAAAKGYVSTLETLLRCGEAGRAQLDRALRAAAGPVAAQLLLHAGADPRARDACGRTPLHCFAHRGLTACVLTLIDFRASVEDKDNWGKTPLHLAVEGDHLDTAKLLLSAGASPLTMDNQGQRPKDLAKTVKMQHLLRR